VLQAFKDCFWLLWFIVIFFSNILFLPQELLHLESLCKQLYETTDTNIRNEAEKALVNFINSPGCLQNCQLLLERAAVSRRANSVFSLL